MWRDAVDSGDPAADGDVDDVIVWQNNYSRTSLAVSVPEPAAIFMLLASGQTTAWKRRCTLSVQYGRQQPWECRSTGGLL